MKCIHCGKPAVAEHCCETCFLERYTNLLGVKEFLFQYCAHCGKYSYTQHWNPRMALSEAIIKSFKENFKFNHKPQELSIEPHLPDVEIQPRTKLKITVEVTIITSLHGLEKKEHYSFPLKITFMLCPQCERQHTEYFEGVMQLRNKASHRFDAALAFIYDEVRKQKHKGIFITQEHPLKDGVDLYCTHQRYLPILAKKVYARFGGECTLNSRNFTMDKLTSKQVYRVNALIRLPSFDPGDIIQVDTTYLSVEGVFGNKVSARDLKLHKKVLLPYKEYDVIVPQTDIIEVQVMKHKPVLEVLDPETYQSVTVANPQEVKGTYVTCARIHGQLWLVT